MRYKKVQRKQAVYKNVYKEVERMVPKRDEYGNVTGYQTRKVKVVVDRIKTGEKSVTVEVPDPEGPIVKTRRIPKYGPGGAALVPNGWWAINGMALYALAESDLGQDAQGRVCGFYVGNPRTPRRSARPHPRFGLAGLGHECHAAATIQRFCADLCG